MNTHCYENGIGLQGRRWAFPPLLFHRTDYLLNHFSESKFLSFTIERNGVIFGVIHFHVSGTVFTSMSKCPFGGISASAAVTIGEIHELIDSVKMRTKEAPITIFTPFDGYPTSAQTMLREVLIQSGFVAHYSDLHQYLLLSPPEVVRQRMHLSQKRRLQKAHAAGFVFAEEPEECLMEVHSFVSNCRTGQGLTINISSDEMSRSIQKLPGVYRAFSVRNGDELVAACITSHVCEEVLYYYLPGSAAAYKNYSPMVMLLFELATWARARSYKVLDLGKSSLHGSEQTGLATFKRRMGAVDGERVCLVWAARPV